MGYCESDEAANELALALLFRFGENSQRGITFHQFAFLVCNALASFAIIISIWHIMMHTLHYLQPYEQKHIIRILFIIPIYASLTFLGLVSYKKSIYFELVRDSYAAYAVASIFTLMCHYIAPNLHEQKEYLRGVKPKNWGWPLNWLQKLTSGEKKGWLRKPTSGVTWFNICYVGIFQYSVLRTLIALVAVITQSFGQFCKGNNPRYASLWTAIIDAISVTVAMYCLEQFYRQLKNDLQPHHPKLKMLSIKILVFLIFWQDWLISILIHFKAIQPTKHVVGVDLRIGIPSLLTCFETVVFAFVHRWAFPWSPYDLDRLPEHPKQFYKGDVIDALLDAMNPWDYFKAFARGFRWLFHGVHFRKNDPSYRNQEEESTGESAGKSAEESGEESEEEVVAVRRRYGIQTEPLPDAANDKVKVREDRKTL